MLLYSSKSQNLLKIEYVIVPRIIKKYAIKTVFLNRKK